jgi:two-component system sensor kinase FixL
MIVDQQGRIAAFNKASERLFGYAADDVVGTDVRLLLAPEHRDGCDACIAALGSDAVPVATSGKELLGLHRNGATMPLELAVGEAATPDGPQLVAVIRDLRRRRADEERLSQLRVDLLRMARVSAMDEMSAALAHELNQPLTALMLYLQAMARADSRREAGAPPPPMVADILDRALREAERAGTIIQRMRHLVEKREPLRRLLDVAPLVDDAVELTLLGSRTGTHITRRLAPDLPRVSVDPIQIQQVVVNLLRNAVEAVKDVGRPDVQVTTALADGSVAITVSDNGPGIPAERVPDLFRAFSAASADGMGLGLTIAKSIAQTHGGDIALEPGGNGRGASVTLKLPVPSPDQ